MHIKKDFGSVVFLVITFLVLMTFSVWYYLYQLPEQQYWVSNEVVSVATTTDAVANNSDWKTYKNEKYGFEFEYQTGLLIRETEQLGNSAIEIYRNDFDFNSKLMQIDVDSKPNEGAGFLVKDYPERVVGSLEEVTIDSNKGTKYGIKWTYNEKTYIYDFINLEKGGIAFRFSDTADYTENESVFDQVIKTFKFTN